MAQIRFAARSPAAPAFNPAPPEERISLGGGYAFATMLPHISEIAAKAAGEFRSSSLQYGPLLGLPELRDEIVKLLVADGVAARRDNILILNGAKNGLDIAMRLLVDKNDSILVTRPNYATSLHIFNCHQVKFIEIEIDQDGIRINQLSNVLKTMRSQGESLPKALYIVPDFHNPAGVTMSLMRRKSVVELAEEYNFVILEDDPYRLIRFEGERLPSIKSFDYCGRVVALGSFSKIFAPGIRVGWANAPVEIVDRMAAMKADGGTSPLLQRIVTLAIQSGLIIHHVKELTKELKAHRDAMVHALHEHMPNVSFRSPSGGYYIWVELPDGVDCDKFTNICEEKNITIFSGTGYFPQKDTKKFVRLCFSNVTIENIHKGISIMGEILSRYPINVTYANVNRNYYAKDRHYD